MDSPTLNQLIGSMQNVQADQGLLVAWGGFKTSVDREVATQFSACACGIRMHWSIRFSNTTSDSMMTSGLSCP